MSEKEYRPIVSRNVLVKQGISAVSCLAGGAVFLIMAIGAQHGLFGIILSALALVVGIGALLSKDAEAKKPGLLIAAAGVLGMILRFVRIPPLQAISGTLLTIGALGLFAAGIWKGVKFLQGLKSRG